MVVHLLHFGFAHPHFFHDHAHELFRQINRQQLHWLHELAVSGLGDDLRLADHKFVAFAAHHLNQDGELQFAAAHDLE